MNKTEIDFDESRHNHRKSLFRKKSELDFFQTFVLDSAADDTSHTNELFCSFLDDNTVEDDKKIYDLEQLLDIAKSLCQNLNFSNLLESIVYICMAQLHVLGAEIFVRSFLTNGDFVLETRNKSEEKLIIKSNSMVAKVLQEAQRPLTLTQLKSLIKSDCDSLRIFEKLNPTLIVPLINKKHLNGIILLQERIAIETESTEYSKYEQHLIMTIGNLASVAINNAVLLEMSSIDMMTHLRLKYHFFNSLEEALDKAFLANGKLGVIMLDIDFFKGFNDAYGHECGDFVLISVADIIKANLRNSDIACRYGGEEFTIMIKDGTKQDVMQIAEKIRKTVEKQDFVYKNQHLHVTISGGVSVFDSKENIVTLPNEFVNQADQALYVSKSSGRNRITFYDEKKLKYEINKK